MSLEHVPATGVALQSHRDALLTGPLRQAQAVVAQQFVLADLYQQRRQPARSACSGDKAAEPGSASAGSSRRTALSSQARDSSGSPAAGVCRRWQPRSVQGENSSNPAGNGKPRAFSSRARDSARWPPAESPASSSRRGEWPASSNAR